MAGNRRRRTNLVVVVVVGRHCVECGRSLTGIDRCLNVHCRESRIGKKMSAEGEYMGSASNERARVCKEKMSQELKSPLESST